jgi:hypothetical protein
LSPTPDRHHKQAVRNCDVYEYLGGQQSSYGDWAATTLFYSGVHTVQEYLHRLPTPLAAKNHKDRRIMLMKLNPSAAASLGTLQNASYEARYRCKMKFRRDELRDLEDLAYRTLPVQLGMQPTK